MSLVRLLQLASPALPVGAYSYSGGLEPAIEAGVVTDATSAAEWIGEVLEHTVARLDAPLIARMIAEPSAAARCNEWLLAGRESAELRAETAQMGYSLAQLLERLGAGTIDLDEIAFPTAFAHAARHWGIDAREALVAYLWSWLENQVLAAAKALPLGQTEAQKMLLALAGSLEAIAERAQAMPEEEIGSCAPRLAILSARHETQYTRLFRS